MRPPAIEYFEVIGRGLDPETRERSLRFAEAESGRLVALRSDLTPQIARMVAQRVGGTIEVGDQVRLCYAADAIATPSNAMESAERHQVGVELLGEVAPHGDAELVALADEALCALGLSSHRFDLGETEVMRRALGRLPEGRREAVRFAMARKDGAELAALLAQIELEDPTRQAIAALVRLYGEPRETLARAREQLAPLELGDELERLEAVLDALASIAPQTLARVELDLGEARGHEYYTGLRVRVWAPGGDEPIIRGGRYDDLLAHYGCDMPASGFALDLDALERALDHAGVGATVDLPPAIMVGLGREQADAKARAHASALASALRAAGRRAWVEVSDDLTRAKARAGRTGCEGLLWLEAGALRFHVHARVEPETGSLDAHEFRASELPAELAQALENTRTS